MWPKLALFTPTNTTLAQLYSDATRSAQWHAETEADKSSPRQWIAVYE